MAQIVVKCTITCPRIHARPVGSEHWIRRITSVMQIMIDLLPSGSEQDEVLLFGSI